MTEELDPLSTIPNLVNRAKISELSEEEKEYYTRKFDVVIKCPKCNDDYTRVVTQYELDYPNILALAMCEKCSQNITLVGNFKQWKSE